MSDDNKLPARNDTIAISKAIIDFPFQALRTLILWLNALALLELEYLLMRSRSK